MDANSLFHRFVVLAQCSDDVAHCFRHELTPFPTALFKDGLMRKPDKPALYKDFAKDLMDVVARQSCVCCRRRRQRWQKELTFRTTADMYVKFIRRFGMSCCVVFDGYADGRSTKDHEHLRRAGKTARVAPDVQLDMQSVIVFHQDSFLANSRNKQQFIKLLADCMTAAHISVVCAPGDAHTSTVAEAVGRAGSGKGGVAVYADDTDILALLLFHRKDSMSSCLERKAGMRVHELASESMLELCRINWEKMHADTF